MEQTLMGLGLIGGTIQTDLLHFHRGHMATNKYRTPSSGRV